MDIVMNVLLGPVHPWLWDIDLRWFDWRNISSCFSCYVSNWNPGLLSSIL